MHSIPRSLLGSSDAPWYVRAVLAVVAAVAAGLFILWQYPGVATLFS